MMSHSHEAIVSDRAFFYAFSLNLLFTVFEFVAAWSAHSVSLLGDASHNLVDVLGLAFAWYANWLLSRKASARYTYGYKKNNNLSCIC